MTIRQAGLSEGDTKRCPQCKGTLVFNNRYPVLSVGISLERSDNGDRMRYERAWVCRDHRCDYRELLGEAS